MNDATPLPPGDDDTTDPDVRFLLANERTLLAWVRTAVAVMAGGLAVLQFATSLPSRATIGTVILAVGALCGVLGLLRYRSADRAIRRGHLPDHGRGPEVLAIGVVVLGGVLALAYLVAEVG